VVMDLNLTPSTFAPAAESRKPPEGWIRDTSPPALNPVLARYLELIELARELRGEPSAGELAVRFGWVCEEAEG
jgi:hypothetical protein